MWLWLQKKLPKVLTLWAKLLLFTSGMHLVFLFVMLFLYKGDAGQFAFEINTAIDANAVVVFLPLQKKAKNTGKPRRGRKGRAASVAQEQVKEKPMAPLVKAEKATTLALREEPKRAAPQSKKKKSSVQRSHKKKYQRNWWRKHRKKYPKK